MRNVIVSFTSYPDRILTIHKVLDSVIKQTRLPDKIILYLSLDEFHNFKNMPELKRYEKYGFEIHWYRENIRSHKKWFYALQEYPDDIIITIDDDILYSATAFENLLKYHEIYPRAVIARRVHLMACNKDGSVASYKKWYDECNMYIGMPRMDLLATTGAGTLFPPHIFEKEILNKEVFMKICPYADDIWLKVMEVYSDIPVVLAEKLWDDCVLLEYQKDCLYENYNGNGGNDEQLKALLKQYIHTHNGMILKDKLFEQGAKSCSEIENLKSIESKRVIEKLTLKIEQNSPLLIYGAGKMGKQIYKLFQYNKISPIEAFIVNDVTDNDEYIEKIPVECYKKFIRGYEKIVIALMDTYETRNVCKQLVKEGISDKRIILLNRIEKQVLLWNR